MSAQDEMGRAIEPSSAFARSWSATGALERVWKRSTLDAELALEAFERANLALAAAIRDVPSRWNDSSERTRQSVLEALMVAEHLVAADSERSPAGDLLDDIDRYPQMPALLSEQTA